MFIDRKRIIHLQNSIQVHVNQGFLVRLQGPQPKKPQNFGAAPQKQSGYPPQNFGVPQGTPSDLHKLSGTTKSPCVVQ